MSRKRYGSLAVALSRLLVLETATNTHMLAGAPENEM